MKKKYGLYESPNGYLFHYYVDENGIGKSIYIHREVMAKKLGRPLKKSELVHHKDENKKNNKQRNLKLISRQDHGRLHAKKAEMIKIICPECKNTKLIFARQYRHNNIKNKSEGPFCGRSCAGKWSRRKQLSGSGGIGRHTTLKT